MAFYDNFGKYGDKIALISETESLTFTDLEENAKNIGNKISQKSLIIQFCENSVGSVAGYLGFLYNRVVPILLNSHLDDELADHLMEVYQPDYIYVPNQIKNKYSEYKIIYEEFDYSLLETDYKYSHRLHDDLALLLTTSGSTGSPKLVRQSYMNIQTNAESIAEYLELDEREKPITTLPMNYTYGLSIINSHILVGATIVLSNRSLTEREFWTFFKEQEATSFGGVPYTFEILKKLRFQRMDLPSLRTMTQAGGKLSPELHKEFAEHAKEQGKRFVVMYGQTEATARMGYLPYEKALEKSGSMGVAIPGGKLYLLDTGGKMIEEPEVVGELVYEGPNVTLGYAEYAADLEKGDERHGVLQTGDMAKKDAEGFLYIVGRKKRFLKIFGNRLNLDETERMVKAKFQLIDCACVGVDDCLSIFITSDHENIKAEIKSFLSEKTGLHPSAFVILFISSIPKNEAGKIQYIELERILNHR
ncbi:AMP-binding protein [Paenibacillus motobuensis]|uniref:AMP-binding protein n=1 Tax=Paenibacillus TaxID=44249 RepID=UPI0020406251|nr:MULTISPECIES: AMP-binding protein [Paenibacillus]MCM3040925.1 AMP-binding protein [Paenibacillus lutimineralis]MCM3648029.1 AMP-binding protein [Paenibacillus motobuensis]